jgi:hypothetical protein
MVFYRRNGATRVGQAMVGATGSGAGTGATTATTAANNMAQQAPPPQAAPQSHTALHQQMAHQPLPAHQAPPALHQQMSMAHQAHQLSAQNNQMFNGVPHDLHALDAAAGTPDLVAQKNVSDAKVDVANSPSGAQMVTTTLPSGIQASLVVPKPSPPPPPQPPSSSVCEFPAQAVQLQRTVNVTNTAPQLVSIEEDVCGNLLSYTESITRQMTAGPWVPVSGLQGPIENFQDVNGVIESTDFGGMLHLANSPAPTTGNPTPTIVQGPFFGSPGAPSGVSAATSGGVSGGAPTRNVRNVVPTHNANRQFGVGSMNRFRSK